MVKGGKSMIRKWGLFAFILLLFYSTPASGEVKVDWESTVSGSNLIAEQGPSWDTGFRLSGDWAFGEKVSFFLRDKVAMNSLSREWAGTLERCYIRYESGSFRANLGRQAVSWGIGWFFRPTDLITPITPLAQEDTRPGKDLVVLRWSTSPLTAVDVIAGDRLYAARGELRLGDTNIRVMGVSHYQPLLSQTVNNLGWDVQGGLAGFYTEGKFAWNEPPVTGGQTTALVGWRKMVWSDRQLFVEYLRDNSGEANPGLYDYSKAAGGERMYLGQNYLATGLQIPLDELTSLSIAGVANLDDGGIMLEGIADVQMTDNLDLRGMVAILAGQENTEFVRLAGNARWNLMVQVKYYF
jgi:hypothetical protein